MGFRGVGFDMNVVRRSKYYHNLDLDSKITLMGFLNVLFTLIVDMLFGNKTFEEEITPAVSALQPCWKSGP
jgi:hypothetical protein